MNNLPDDFDFDQKVIDFQFAMMIQMRYGLEKRITLERANLRKYLKEHFTDNSYVEKIMKKVELRAYHTIPGEFWKNLPQ